MKKLICLCFLSSFLSACVYYHSPNHRAPESPGTVVAKSYFGGLETEGQATKYDLFFKFHYDYRKSKAYPTRRDFTLTKKYSAFADSEAFKQNPTQFIPGYKPVAGFEHSGTWEFDETSCSLSLGNEETGFQVNLTGKVDRRYETSTGSGRYVTYMAYTVEDATLPELEKQVFYGQTADFVCKLGDYLKEHKL